MADLLSRIEIDPGVMLGKPVIRGTRIPVEDIVKDLAAEMAWEEILRSYPRLAREDIAAALEFAAESLRADGDGVVDGTGVSGNAVKVYRQAADGTWQVLVAQVSDPGRNWVEATTPGFSVFALGAGTPAEAASGGSGDDGGRMCAAAGLGTPVPAFVLVAALAGLRLRAGRP